MMSAITCVSQRVLEELQQGIATNLPRYEGDGFRDLAEHNGWSVSVDIPINYDRLSEIDGTERGAEADLRNTQIVIDALTRLTPSLASEERVWVRLTHVECFDYAKRRWGMPEGSEQEKAARNVKKHFFAAGVTGVRDDNAISRLWWNGYIARQLMPEDPSTALKLILSSADARQALIERPWLSTRRPLLAGMLRAMRDRPEIRRENPFREFVKTVNREGGGVVFEAMSDREVDAFVARCISI